MAAPTLSSSSPTTLPTDGAWRTVTLTGTNFATGIVVSSVTPGVHLTGSTYVSATSATVKVLCDPSVRGAISLTLTNLDAGTVTDTTHTPKAVTPAVTKGAYDAYPVNPVPGAIGTSVVGTVPDNVVVGVGAQSPSAAPFQDAVSSPMATTHFAINPAFAIASEASHGFGQQGASADFPGLVAPHGAEDTGDLEQDALEADTEGVPLGDHSAQVPGVPTSVAATPGIATHATVTWVAPVDADGFAMTGYTVTAVSSDGGTSPVTKTVGNVLTADVSGLTSAKHYTFTVQAISVGGTSAASSASGSTLIV